MVLSTAIEQKHMTTEKAHIDRILAEQHNGTSYLYLFTSRHIPGKGWYAIADKPRYYNDSGEYLGATFAVATKNASNIYGLNTWGNNGENNQPRKTS